jgi:copper(I)-binding protein
MAISLLFLANNASADHINIENARIPEAAPVAKVMAAYMDISNKAKDASYITRVSSPQFKKVEIHSMFHKDGMMHMEKQDKLKLPAGKTTSLQPGGFHMMLFNPKKWYQAGSKINLKITLDDKHTFNIVVPVIKDQDGEHHHHH